MLVVLLGCLLRSFSSTNGLMLLWIPLREQHGLSSANLAVGDELERAIDSHRLGGGARRALGELAPPVRRLHGVPLPLLDQGRHILVALEPQALRDDVGRVVAAPAPCWCGEDDGVLAAYI